MTNSRTGHDIVLDEKRQEQPRTKDRAVDPSSKRQPKPDKGGRTGHYPAHQRVQGDLKDKT